MNYFWLDANAIVKQYVTEKGTPLINHFFTRVSFTRILCLLDSIAETYHVFDRKSNDGTITRTEFNQAIQQFEDGFNYRADLEKANATQKQKAAARQFIDAYRIGRTDTYILRCALDKADELRVASDNLVLVSSDKKLLRAAKKERLLTFDPETDNQIDIDFLINSP